MGDIAAVQSIHLWNSDTRRFESWRRSAPDFANTLDFVPIGAGLWVQVSGPVAWSVPPLSAVGGEQEAPGFRLLGWTDVDTAPVEALRDFAGDAIFGWDEFRQQFVSFFPELPGPLNSLSSSNAAGRIGSCPAMSCRLSRSNSRSERTPPST